MLIKLDRNTLLLTEIPTVYIYIYIYIYIYHCVRFKHLVTWSIQLHCLTHINTVTVQKCCYPITTTHCRLTIKHVPYYASRPTLNTTQLFFHHRKRMHHSDIKTSPPPRTKSILLLINSGQGVPFGQIYSLQLQASLHHTDPMPYRLSTLQFHHHRIVLLLMSLILVSVPYVVPRLQRHVHIAPMHTITRIITLHYITHSHIVRVHKRCHSLYHIFI